MAKTQKRSGSCGQETLFRHGDVLILSVASGKIPPGLRRLEGGVLAEGEVTGHAHRIENPPDVELYQDKARDVLYLRVKVEKGTTARVVHEEHAPIELPPGVYRVWKQREYDPNKHRYVAD